MAAHARIVETLGKSNIKDSPVPSSGVASASAASNEEILPPGLPVESLVEALSLHAKQPKTWTASALATKFGVSDEAQAAALESALAHCTPFRAVESDGRMRGVPIGPDDAAPQRDELA
jgi:hypothetical protein